MTIPLSAPDITEAEIDAVIAVLRTPHLSLGPELAAFESALAAYHAVPHAVAVSSGTAGLHLALLTLNIGAGDEVIIPSFAFIAVSNAVLQVRATPVFAEIDPVTLNLDPKAVEQAITLRTRAILVVHTFGVPADMDALQSIARRHNLALIEDACEAIGAEFQGRLAGSFGDLAVLGFYPNKQLTTGEGGAILAHNANHAGRLRSLRNQGRQPGADWLDHAEPGYNYRLSDIACALGRVQLSRIEEMLALRQSAALRYNPLRPRTPTPGSSKPHNQLVRLRRSVASIDRPQPHPGRPHPARHRHRTLLPAHPPSARMAQSTRRRHTPSPRHGIHRPAHPCTSLFQPHDPRTAAANRFRPSRRPPHRELTPQKRHSASFAILPAATHLPLTTDLAFSTPSDFAET